MGSIVSEGLEYIGRIDDSGYVFDQSDNCIATITDSGYILKSSFEGGTYGKIDEDGTIRNASGRVVGRIQADGYVYIHSKRVCKVSSSFVERITPKAWNAGDISSFSGRKKAPAVDVAPPSLGFLASPFFIKLVIGIILGIVLMANGSGASALIGGPFLVFLFCFFAKLFG